MKTEDYKNYWTKSDKILMGLLMFSLLFLMTFLGILYEIASYGLEFSIFFTIITIIFLPFVVRWAFKYRKDFLDRFSLADLYRQQRRTRYIVFSVLGVVVSLVIVTIFLREAFTHLIPWPETEIFGYLLIPIFFAIISYQLLSTEGEIEVEFEQLTSSWDNFGERQKWMVRVFKRLEISLRTGFIDISHRDLCYQLNISNPKIEEIQEDLESTKNWLLKKEKNTNILNHIRNMSPKIEFKRLRVRPRLHIFKVLANNEKYLGYLVFVILILIEQESLVTVLEELVDILL